MFQSGMLFLFMLAVFNVGYYARSPAIRNASGLLLIGLGLACAVPGFVR